MNFLNKINLNININTAYPYTSVVGYFKNTIQGLTQKGECRPHKECIEYEDDNIIIICPKNQAEAIKYGQGTKWCTSAKVGTNNQFKKYTGTGQNLYYVTCKKENKKYGVYKTEGDEYGIENAFDEDKKDFFYQVWDENDISIEDVRNNFGHVLSIIDKIKFKNEKFYKQESKNRIYKYDNGKIIVLEFKEKMLFLIQNKKTQKYTLNAQLLELKNFEYFEFKNFLKRNKIKLEAIITQEFKIVIKENNPRLKKLTLDDSFKFLPNYISNLSIDCNYCFNSNHDQKYLSHIFTENLTLTGVPAYLDFLNFTDSVIINYPQNTIQKFVLKKNKSYNITYQHSNLLELTGKCKSLFLSLLEINNLEAILYGKHTRNSLGSSKVYNRNILINKLNCSGVSMKIKNVDLESLQFKNSSINFLEIYSFFPKENNIESLIFDNCTISTLSLTSLERCENFKFLEKFSGSLQISQVLFEKYKKQIHLTGIKKSKIKLFPEKITQYSNKVPINKDTEIWEELYHFHVKGQPLHIQGEFQRTFKVDRPYILG